MIQEFVARFDKLFPHLTAKMPWDVVEDLDTLLRAYIRTISGDYEIKDGVVVHRSAVIEQNVVLKPPVFVGNNCTICANAYIRGPVFLDESVKVGAGCEVKQSMIFSNTAIAHFNYIGNSIIGSDVNFEAGSVSANHYNERENKMIKVVYDGTLIDTGVQKFGSVTGDRSRIGANAVLSPGTLLHPGTVVGRLELVKQWEG